MAVGIGYPAAVMALWAGYIYHNWTVNDIEDLRDTSEYYEKLSKLNKFIALMDTRKCAAFTFLTAFLGAIGLLSIPAVGPIVAGLVGVGFAYDGYRVAKMKAAL